MTRPDIPNRLTRMRVGEQTQSDLSDPDLDRIQEFLESRGFSFDREPDMDGGVWLICTRSPNVVTTIGEGK